jgi:MoaA/NifB/PqqE/SkfB family radical SAM enzyme
MPASLTPPLPTALQVEVTSACNLRCAMCLVRYRPPVNKLAGAMPFATLRRLVDDVPGLRRLTLQGLGEPLLAPDLLDMIGYAKSRGVRVGFNSNATLLSRARADELVAAGLDWLHVSLDGADAGTFESIREGASFDRVVANLAGLVEAKRAAGSATPWLRVVFVAMRRNVAQLPDLVALLARIGVNDLRVQNLSHSFGDTDPAGAYREIREYAADQALWTGADRRAAEAAYERAGRLAPETRGGAAPARAGRLHPPGVRLALGLGVRDQRGRGAAVLHGDGRRPDVARPAVRTELPGDLGRAGVPRVSPPPAGRRPARGVSRLCDVSRRLLNTHTEPQCRAGLRACKGAPVRCCLKPRAVAADVSGYVRPTPTNDLESGGYTFC